MLLAAYQYYMVSSGSIVAIVVSARWRRFVVMMVLVFVHISARHGAHDWFEQTNNDFPQIAHFAGSIQTQGFRSTRYEFTDSTRDV